MTGFRETAMCIESRKSTRLCPYYKHYNLFHSVLACELQLYTVGLLALNITNTSTFFNMLGGWDPRLTSGQQRTMLLTTYNTNTAQSAKASESQNRNLPVLVNKVAYIYIITAID